MKQKGIVRTLTPTMLFTTFMMRPELDAVISARFLTGVPPSYSFGETKQNSPGTR